MNITYIHTDRTDGQTGQDRQTYRHTYIHVHECISSFQFQYEFHMVPFISFPNVNFLAGCRRLVMQGGGNLAMIMRGDGLPFWCP